MCGICGCDGHDHDGHDHHHHHHHDHDHVHPDPRTLAVERDILARNDETATGLRAWFRDAGVLAVNLVSSPGAGKTTLLERTIRALEGRIPVAVLEGDQATSRDADRIAATGVRAIQINTGTGCHLDARMVEAAAKELAPVRGSVLFVENVGNLVCPALFDLGEDARVVVASVTEGDDKPQKYPYMFRTATLVVLNKVDLLPHVDFDLDAFHHDLRHVSHAAMVLPVSARTGDGMGPWLAWIERRMRGTAR